MVYDVEIQNRVHFGAGAEHIVEEDH